MKKMILGLILLSISALSQAGDKSANYWSVKDILDENRDDIYCEVYDSDVSFWISPEKGIPGKIDFMSGQDKEPVFYNITRIFPGEAAFSLNAKNTDASLEIMVSRVPGHRGGLRSLLDMFRGTGRSNTNVFQAEVKFNGEDALEAFCVGVKPVQ